MNYSRLIFLLALGVAVILLFISCGNSTGTDKIDFDRPGMLSNYGNNIILPAYESFQNSINNLESSAETFAGDPSQQHLETLQAALKEARIAWQEVNLFQFGPAEAAVLRPSLNTYPPDVEKIDENISTGEYTFGTISNRDAEGFPALDYLLHGTGSDNQEILSKYTDDAEAESRTGYLLENIAFINQKTTDTVNDWSQNGGNYIGKFLSEENSGIDVGSSLSMLFNSFVLHYERFFRDGKIGIPSGVRSAGVPRPTATEAYYGGYSLELAIANIATIRRFIDGRDGNGNNGLGLADHLDALGAVDLTEEVRNELEEAQVALEKLNDPLSQEIENSSDSENNPVTEAFTEIHEIVSLFKSDVTSVLGINITYQDNDGD